MKLLGFEVVDLDETDLRRVTIATKTIPMASLLANLQDANWVIEVQPIKVDDGWVTTFKRGNSDNGTIYPR